MAIVAWFVLQPIKGWSFFHDCPLTFNAFNDPINSSKSLGSFIGTSLRCNDIQHDIKALLGRQRTVIGAIGRGGGGMRTELANGPIHIDIVPYGNTYRRRYNDYYRYCPSEQM